jgi:hypothetical protein
MNPSTVAAVISSVTRVVTSNSQLKELLPADRVLI